MYKTLDYRIFGGDCPKGVEVCQRDQYIARQDVFRRTVNDSLLEPTKPYSVSRDEIIGFFDSINIICAECRKTYGKKEH